MKWHQRRCDGSEKPLEDAIYREWKASEGHEVFGIYMHLYKVMARGLDAELEAFRCGRTDIVRPIITEDVDFLASECRTTPERFLAVTAWLRKKGELTVRQLSGDKSRVTLEMPNILRDIDNYTRTAINKICEERRIPSAAVLKVYVESTKTLRRVSSLSRADSSTDSVAKAEQGGAGGAAAAPRPDPADPSAPAGGPETPSSPSGGLLPAAPPPAPPPPAPPPRAAAAAAATAARLSPEADLAAMSLDINSRHPFSVKLLLSRSFTVKQAIQWARSTSVREICAAVGQAEEARAGAPGAYVHSLLKIGAKRNAQLSFPAAAELRRSMADFDKLYAAMGGGRDPYDFAPTVSSSGTLFGIPQQLRAAR